MNIRTQLNHMSRQEIITILESHGFACYDSETTEELQEALAVNIEDGTISETELQ